VMVESGSFKRIEDIGFVDSSRAIGMEARRALHPGDMLTPKDIRNKPLVRRNQLVTVWSRAGALVVQSTGRALREASLGEQIEIRADGSQDKFHATVTGPATVAVGPGSPKAC